MGERNSLQTPPARPCPLGYFLRGAVAPQRTILRRGRWMGRDTAAEAQGRPGSGPEFWRGGRYGDAVAGLVAAPCEALAAISGNAIANALAFARSSPSRPP